MRQITNISACIGLAFVIWLYLIGAYLDLQHSFLMWGFATASLWLPVAAIRATYSAIKGRASVNQKKNRRQLALKKRPQLRIYIKRPQPKTRQDWIDRT